MRAQGAKRPQRSDRVRRLVVIGGLLRQQMGFRGLVVTDKSVGGGDCPGRPPRPPAAATAVAAKADLVLFGSTLTPGQTAALAPDGVMATMSEMVAAIVRATRTGARSPATDAVEQAITAVPADLWENST
jgi:beta-glucosidase-like glycosyl hydrolase